MTAQEGFGESTLPPRLLVAEDNVTNQKLARAMLTRLSYAPDVVDNGAEAVAAFRQTDYAAILMDCQMPVMDGYAATAAIREIEQGETRIPIIAMTASAMAGAAQRCLAAGMDDYVPKPIMLDQLAGALRRWVIVRPAAASSSPSHERFPVSEDAFDAKRIAALRALNEPGKPDTFMHFALAFVDQAGVQVTALGEALTEGDAERARREAHRLRGGAGTVGAVRLASLCGELEERLIEGAAARADAFPPIEAEFRHVRSSLAERSMALGYAPPPGCY